MAVLLCLAALGTALGSLWPEAHPEAPPACAVPAAKGEGCEAPAGTLSGAARLVYGLKLDLNRASAAELAELDGIGPSLAQAIIEHRERRGGFSSLAQLEEVPGIGPARLATLSAAVEVVQPASRGVWTPP